MQHRLRLLVTGVICIYSDIPFYAPPPYPAVGGVGIMLSGRLSYRPSVDGPLTPVSLDAISLYLLSGRISMQLVTNIRHVRGHSFKGFPVRRSKVKGHGYSETKCTYSAEAYMSMAWRRGSLVLLLLGP